MVKKGKGGSLSTIGFMLAAVLCAAIAGILLSNLMGNTYSGQPVHPVLVAATRIVAGQPFKKEDLRIAQWPRNAIPAGAFTKPDDLLRSGRVPLISYTAGEVVLSHHLSPAKAGIGIAPLIEKDHRAMSIRTDDPVALARLLYPGARVDLISTIKPSRGGGNVTSKIVIQNAKVLAVGEDIDPLTMHNSRRKGGGGAMSGSDSDSGGGGEGKDAARGVVTLSVTPEQAERLSLASREGKIDIVLRSPNDSDTVSTSGATPTGLLGGEEASVVTTEIQPIEVEKKPTVTPQPRKRRATRSRVMVGGGGKKNNEEGSSGGGGGGPIIIKGGS